MRSTVSTLAALLAVLAMAGPSWAASVLATAPVRLSDDCPLCTAVNIGTKPIKKVTVEVIQVDVSCPGCIWGSQTCTNLAPNGICWPGIGCIGAATVYCKVTVDGSKRAIRAALAPDDEAHGPIVSVPAQ